MSCNITFNNIEYSAEDFREKVLSGEIILPEPQEVFLNTGDVPATKADTKTISLMKQVLKNIGVDISVASRAELKDMGVSTNWAGMADMMNKVVLLVEGRENVAITEETAHFIVEIVKQTNPSLYKNMFNKIGSYPIYNEVKGNAQYRSAYRTSDNKLDIPKLKDEAIGKLLAENIIKESQGVSDIEELITPAAEQTQTDSWWEQIVGWLKELFNKTFGQNENNPYKELAKQVVGGTFDGNANDIQTEESMFSFESNPLYNKIVEGVSKIVKKSNGKYAINGEEISNTITSAQKGDLNKRDEFLEGVNQRGKEDIANILKQYIDGDGLRRENPLPSSAPKLGSNKVQELLERNIANRLSEYPEGTRFMYNAPLYSSFGDSVANADFLAVSPEGKVDVLTFDFLSYNTDKGVSAQQKERLYKYIGDIKTILKNNYGVTEFGKTRSIPILVNYSSKEGKYSLTNVAIGGTDISTTPDYANPLPTPDEVTGDKKVDDLLKKLNALANIIASQKAPEGRRDIKYAELNKIFSAIRHLQLSKDFTPLFEQIENILNNTDELLSSINDKIASGNITPEEEVDIAQRLNNFEEYLNLYRNIDTYFRNYFGEDEQDNEEKLRSLAQKSKFTYEHLKEQRLEFVRRFISEKNGVEGIENAEKVYKGVGKLFRPLSQSPIAAQQTLARMVEYTRNKTDFEVKELVDELEEIKATKETAQLIIKPDTNELVDEYKSEFYQELKEKISAKDVKWIKENTNHTKFEEWAKQYRERRLQDIEDSTPVGTTEEQLAQKKEWSNEVIAQTDLTKDYAWLQYNNVRKFPTEQWYSDSYKKVEASPTALKLFNFIKKLNKEAMEVGYLNPYQARTFLPSVRNSFLERLLGGDISFTSSLINAITIDEATTGYGNINPLTGELINSIPIYFTRSLPIKEQSTDLTKNLILYIAALTNYKNKSEIEEQAKLLIYVEKNKPSLQTNAYSKIVRDATGEPTMVEGNDENTKTLSVYVRNIIYGHKYPGSDTIDVLGGKLGDSYNKAADKINGIVGRDMIKKVSPSRQLSIVKVIEGVNKFFQLKVLGLNLSSSISQFMGGNFQALINSGKYFTRNDFMASEYQIASAKVLKNDKVTLALIKEFIPLSEGDLHFRMKELSLNKMSKVDVQDSLMSLMRKADHIVQYSIFLSMMRNAVVVDGKLINARDYVRNSPEFASRYTNNTTKEQEAKFEEQVQKLIEERGFMNSLDIKGDKLVMPNIDKDSFFKYRSLLQSMARDAAGNILPTDLPSIHLNILGKSFMVFKSWIPRPIDIRFGELKENSGADTYEYGRVRMLAKMMFETTGLNLKRLSDVTKANEEGIKTLNEFYNYKKKEYEERTNKPFNMSEAEFNDMVRQNLKSTYKDALAALTLLSLFFFIKANAPDDDEAPRTKSFYKYSLRTIDKVSDELLFYYNPIGLQQIAGGSIFPAIGVMTDAIKLTQSLAQQAFGIGFTSDGLLINDDDVREKAKPTKYLMRATPFLKEISVWLPIINPDLAKEMGIQMPTEARIH